MKIGNFTIPLYFNREFLKFKPFSFLKSIYEHSIFWITMPFFGFLFGLVGGLLDWASGHGFGVFKDGMAESFLNLLRSKTFFDLWITDGFDFIGYSILGVDKGSGLALFLGWFLLAFLWFIKIGLACYFYSKIYYIFFYDSKYLTYDGVVEFCNNEFKDIKTEEEIKEIIASSWKKIEMYKKY